MHHKALVADPVGTVAKLYRHFGRSSRRVAAAVGRYARQRPNGGYGPRDYHFEDHGLDGGRSGRSSATTWRTSVRSLTEVAVPQPTPRARKRRRTRQKQV